MKYKIKIFGWDLVRSLLVTVKYFFGKKVTIQYPEQQRLKPARFRGIPCLLTDAAGKEKCIACKLCEKICPSQAISVDVKKHELDVGKCLVCGACVEICPVNALKMSSKLYYPIANHADLIFSKKRLLDMGQ
jgi:NADH-quinone oxidoreductase chain I